VSACLTLIPAARQCSYSLNCPRQGFTPKLLSGYNRVQLGALCAGRSSSLSLLNMSVDVLTFGLNHVSAPLSVRERVSMPLDVMRPALEGLRSAFGSSVREAAILSTCN